MLIEYTVVVVPCDLFAFKFTFVFHRFGLNVSTIVRTMSTKIQCTHSLCQRKKIIFFITAVCGYYAVCVCAVCASSFVWHIFPCLNDHLLSHSLNLVTSNGGLSPFLIDYHHWRPSTVHRTYSNNIINLPFQSTWIRWHSDNKYNLSFVSEEKEDDTYR